MSHRGKIFLLFLLSIPLLLPSCQYAEKALPIVNVDHDHDFMSEHTDENGSLIQDYKIMAGSGFILDIEDWEFQAPSHLAVFNVHRPNQVVVYVKRGRYDSDFSVYYANWKNTATSLALTSRTLVPQEDTEKPFSGLESGQEVTVVIGFYDKDGQTTGREIFYPFWGAAVHVQ